MSEQREQQLRGLRAIMLYNLGILAIMLACVVFVAVWLHSAAGLWSLLLMFVMGSYGRDCSCEKDDDEA